MKELNLAVCFTIILMLLINIASANVVDVGNENYSVTKTKYNKSDPTRYKKTVPIRQVVHYGPYGYNSFNGYNGNNGHNGYHGHHGYNGYHHGYNNGYVYNIMPPPIVVNRVTEINTQNGKYRFSDPEVHYYDNYYAPQAGFSVKTNNVFWGF